MVFRVFDDAKEEKEEDKEEATDSLRSTRYLLLLIFALLLLLYSVHLETELNTLAIFMFSFYKFSPWSFRLHQDLFLLLQAIMKLDFLTLIG